MPARHPPRALLVLLSFALAACVATPPRGADGVATLLRERQASAAAVASAERADDAASREVAVPDAPLAVADALRLAYTRNPHLAARYAALGIARAEVIAAGRLSGPTVSYSRLTGGGAEAIGAGLTQSFSDLLLLPLRSRVATAEFERSERELAAELAAFGSEVESAWIEAVAAEQVSAVRELGRRAAAASAELAQRYFEAGNITRLQLAQEQAAAAEARIEALRGVGAARQARRKLAGLMGLPSSAAWTLPVRLPIPPETEVALAELQSRASMQRLDLAAADRAVAAAEVAAAGARHLRWLGGLDLGIPRERGPRDPIQRGPTIALTLPLFGQGQAMVARADAELAAARARRAELALAIDHEVALAADQLDGARQIVALHRDALLPAREAIVARTQERVNYMLVGSFELLAERRAAYAAYQSYLEALRDFSLARVALARAVGGPLGAAEGSTDGAGADDLLPPAEDHSHMHHGEHP